MLTEAAPEVFYLDGSLTERKTRGHSKQVTKEPWFSFSSPAFKHYKACKTEGACMVAGSLLAGAWSGSELMGKMDESEFNAIINASLRCQTYKDDLEDNFPAGKWT